MPIPRPEYPRMQFRRDSWLNLNGLWTCELDLGCSGMERHLHESKGFAQTILVPFCPESKLSGLQHTDFIPAMFYHKRLEIPADWQGKRILLNFGAVDYIATIYIDGTFVARHVGGSSSFSVDITDIAPAGTAHDLVVAVQDDLRTMMQGAGKQSLEYASHGCVYTRVTGIWQTVDLEAAGMYGLKSCRIVPDFDSGKFVFTPVFYAERQGAKLVIDILDNGKVVTTAVVPATSAVPVAVAVPSPHAWSPEDPFLYDIRYRVLSPNGLTEDEVFSYAGLRKIHIEGNQLFLNNKPLYFRSVLDQGFYPDGIWTAPSDEALENDIKLSMAAGFNGARLHQKVFEERFHYHADKLGYLTWAEYPSWGMACTRDARNPCHDYHHAVENHLREWAQCVMRDANHPSIIAWTPQNETYPVEAELDRYRDYITNLYDLTKQLDPTRPVNDSSGWMHVKTDLYTVHRYCPDANALHEKMTSEPDQPISRNYPKIDAPYRGQPFLVDEWGGFKFVPIDKRDSTQAGWGYHGLVIDTPQQLLDKISEQIDALLAHPFCCGYTYTQLTDVEQEQNGILSYDRTPKAPLDKFKELFGKNPT